MCNQICRLEVAVFTMHIIHGREVSVSIATPSAPREKVWKEPFFLLEKCMKCVLIYWTSDLPLIVPPEGDMFFLMLNHEIHHWLRVAKVKMKFLMDFINLMGGNISLCKRWPVTLGGCINNDVSKSTSQLWAWESVQIPEQSIIFTPLPGLRHAVLSWVNSLTS